MRNFISLVLLFLSIPFSFSQKQGSELIDSLKGELKNSVADTAKVRLLGKLSFQYFNFDTDSGIFYAEQAILLAKRLKWGLGIAFSYNYLGVNYGVKGNYPKALECFNTSLSKYTEIDDKQGIAFLSNNLGNFYRILKKPAKAIVFFTKSIVINKELKNKQELIKTYNNLGFAYSDLSDFSTSDKYYFEALNLAKEIRNNQLIAKVLVNISENKTRTKDYCTALELSIQAVKISEELNIPYDRAMYNSYVGEIYLKITGDSINIAGNCQYFSKNKLENLLKAKQYLLNSNELLNKIHDLALLSDNSLLLSQVYEKLGDTKNALLFYKKYSTNKDSVFSEDNSVKIANLEKKREVELKDRQITIQNLEIEKKNAQIISQIVLFILVLLITSALLYFYFTKQQKQKARKAESELIKAKEKAEESDRLKSAFLANMSHEIRTPMNGILGFAELLKEPNLTGDQQQSYIRVIEKSGARMLNIINDIIDISKIESGQMELSISKTDINKQIGYVYSFFKPEADDKGIRLLITNTLPSKEATIETDREKIYAILTNLVKNAIKYTNAGFIEFGCQRMGDFLEFFVKDTGIGIPKDRQEAIFDRFVQADIADIQALQGAGLGLSITKAYVEMLGGKIRVNSAEGEGSVFYFTIPFNTDQDSAGINKNGSLETKDDKQMKRLKVLIAEDDETSEMFITMVIRKYSHEVMKVRTGAEAVEVCRNNPDIDLVLMDIRMPGVNGIIATHQIREFNKDVIIIAQTAYALSGDKKKAIDAGCNEYITKPLNQALLLELLQKHFSA